MYKCCLQLDWERRKYICCTVVDKKIQKFWLLQFLECVCLCCILLTIIYFSVWTVGQPKQQSYLYLKLTAWCMFPPMIWYFIDYMINWLLKKTWMNAWKVVVTKTGIFSNQSDKMSLLLRCSSSFLCVSTVSSQRHDVLGAHHGGHRVHAWQPENNPQCTAHRKVSRFVFMCPVMKHLGASDLILTVIYNILVYDWTLRFSGCRSCCGAQTVFSQERRPWSFQNLMNVLWIQVHKGFLRIEAVIQSYYYQSIIIVMIYKLHCFISSQGVISLWKVRRKSSWFKSSCQRIESLWSRTGRVQSEPRLPGTVTTSALFNHTDCRYRFLASKTEILQTWSVLVNRCQMDSWIVPLIYFGTLLNLLLILSWIPAPLMRRRAELIWSSNKADFTWDTTRCQRTPQLPSYSR